MKSGRPKPQASSGIVSRLAGSPKAAVEALKAKPSVPDAQASISVPVKSIKEDKYFLGVWHDDRLDALKAKDQIQSPTEIPSAPTITFGGCTV